MNIWGHFFGSGAGIFFHVFLWVFFNFMFVFLTKNMILTTIHTSSGIGIMD